MTFHPRLLLFLLPLLVGCSTQPAFTIPDPWPEAMEWARADAGEGGNFLGLKTRENDSGSLDALFFEPGVRVVRVIEDSPAAQAGIQVGDVVLIFDGTELNDPGALESLVQGSQADVETRLSVQRDDTVFDVPVRLRASAGGDLAEVEVLHHVDRSHSLAGWADARGGALLVASEDEAPFPAAGVPVGSVVTELEGRSVLSARDLIRRLQVEAPGADVEVAFRDRAGASSTATVELFDQETLVTGFMIPILFHYTHEPDRDSTEWALIDLYFISLFRYIRDGNEEEYRFLRWFQFSSGEGELAE